MERKLDGVENPNTKSVSSSSETPVSTESFFRSRRYVSVVRIAEEMFPDIRPIEPILMYIDGLGPPSRTGFRSHLEYLKMRRLHTRLMKAFNSGIHRRYDQDFQSYVLDETRAGGPITPITFGLLDALNEAMANVEPDPMPGTEEYMALDDEDILERDDRRVNEMMKAIQEGQARRDGFRLF